MNLVIDIGNTNTKYYIYNGDNIIYSLIEESFDASFIPNFKTKFPNIENCILSATGNYQMDNFLKLPSLFKNFIKFSQNTDVPVKIDYHSPKTLGLDRLAGACGAFAIYPKKNVLIIDAGTAITFDIKNQKEEFIGGNISPGLFMRFKALNHYTKNLPLINSTKITGFLGKDTSNAISNGVINGMIYEINGYIEECTKKFNPLKIIITGGDAHFFENKLKKAIFVHQNIVALGLNTILNFNMKNFHDK